MNTALYRAKLKEIRDAVTNPAGPSGVHALGGQKWTTTFSAGATFARIRLRGTLASIVMVIQKSDMYVQGFISTRGEFKFTDAVWSIAAQPMGYGSTYADLGWNRLSAYPGFTPNELTAAIDNLLMCSSELQWRANKSSVLKLVLAFAEGSRFHSVQKSVENGSDVHDIDWNAGGNRVLALVKG